MDRQFHKINLTVPLKLRFTRANGQIQELEDKLNEKAEALWNKQAEIRGFLPSREDLIHPSDLGMPERDANGNYKIVCPYCLKKYEIKDLLFRATAVANANHIYENTFLMEKDEVLKKHWENMGNKVPNATRPHILNMDPKAGEIRDVTLTNGESQQTLPYDQKARALMEKYKAVRLTDKYGHASSLRICPHCHTELPENIGFKPNYVFVLMGNSSCGKTVYLYRLILSLLHGNFLDGNYYAEIVNDEASQRDAAIDVVARNMFRDRDRALSDPTDVKYIRPVMLELSRYDRPGESFYITLFDFPGEALWTQSDFFTNLARSNFDNSSGWLFMFDAGTLDFIHANLPLNMRQLPEGEVAEDRRAGPQTILQQAKRVYQFGQLAKPVAFNLTKSDLVRQCAGQLAGSYLGSNPRFLSPAAPHSKVDLEDLYLCDKEIRSMLNGTGVVRTGDFFTHYNCAWFASSSTSVPLEGGRIPENATLRGLRDTCALEWLLYRWGCVDSSCLGHVKEVTTWVEKFQADPTKKERLIQEHNALVSEVNSILTEIDDIGVNFDSETLGVSLETLGSSDRMGE